MYDCVIQAIDFLLLIYPFMKNERVLLIKKNYMNEYNNQKKSFFDNFSPKTNFFIGIGSILTLFFVVGFFVLFSIVLDKDKTNTKESSNDRPTVTAPSPTVPPPGAPGEVSLVPVSRDDWVKGNRNAKVNIIEFSMDTNAE